jgi:hypothetical protein
MRTRYAAEMQRFLRNYPGFREMTVSGPQNRFLRLRLPGPSTSAEGMIREAISAGAPTNTVFRW